MVFSLSEGQDKLLIALRGLWRRYESGELGYTMLIEAYEEAKRRGVSRELREAGVLSFTSYEGEPYLLVDVNKLKEFYKTKCKEILSEG